MALQTASTVFVSQEYFDEICVENYEMFEEDSYDAAVEETLLQLQGKDLRHISTTYPESHPAIRQRISRFKSAVSSLKSCDSAAASSDCMDLETSLSILSSEICGKKRDEETTPSSGPDDPSTDTSVYLYHHLFCVEGGFLAAAEAFSFFQHHQDNCSLDILLDLLDQFPYFAAKEFLSEFQATFPSKCLAAWMSCLESNSLARQQLLLSLAYKSILRCESNKRLWMTNKNNKERPWSELLVQQIRWSPTTTASAINNNRDDNDASRICLQVCRIVSCLCTFDDFSEDSSDQHQYVQKLFRAGALSVLEDGLHQKTTPHSVVVNALRAMAIQDEVVQSMGSVVSKAKLLLVGCCCSEESSKDKEALATALIGLFRNVSANDSFKRQLGSDIHLLGALHSAMAKYKENEKLQEHAIAWLGALALRQQETAIRLASPSSGFVSLIVAAMQKFVTRASLQRQAALAIRNMAGRMRESDEQVKSFLRSEVKEALTTIAAKHMHCQDEVYAALRDLGLPVSSLHVERNGENVEIRKGPIMFGQGLQSNFRAEYDA